MLPPRPADRDHGIRRRAALRGRLEERPDGLPRLPTPHPEDGSQFCQPQRRARGGAMNPPLPHGLPQPAPLPCQPWQLPALFPSSAQSAFQATAASHPRPPPPLHCARRPPWTRTPPPLPHCRPLLPEPAVARRRSLVPAQAAWSTPAATSTTARGSRASAMAAVRRPTPIVACERGLGREGDVDRAPTLCGCVGAARVCGRRWKMGHLRKTARTSLVTPCSSPCRAYADHDLDRKGRACYQRERKRL